MERAATFAVMVMMILLFCSVIAHGYLGKPAQSETGETESLLVYCGAGMRAPMNELGSQFEHEYGVKVVCNYAGSGHLLNLNFGNQKNSRSHPIISQIPKYRRLNPTKNRYQPTP